ncbi:MAG: hypothetical protein ACRDNF_05565, partial [Streptosporangiaceae bacterium]
MQYEPTPYDLGISEDPEATWPEGQPLAEWAQQHCPPDHHVLIEPGQPVRFVPDTPEIAAHDEAVHHAATEWAKQTEFYVAPPTPEAAGAAVLVDEPERESDREEIMSDRYGWTEAEA